MENFGGAWKRAFDQRTRRRGYVVEIYLGDDEFDEPIIHQFTTFDAPFVPDKSTPGQNIRAGVSHIESAAPQTIGVIDRRVTVGDIEIVFVDDLSTNFISRIRELTSTVLLKGAFVSIDIGTFDLDYDDFERIADRWIIEDIKSLPGEIRLIAVDPSSLREDLKFSPFLWPDHPLKVLAFLYGYMSGENMFVGTSGGLSWFEVQYESTSHFVVCRQQYNPSIPISTVFSVGGELVTLTDDARAKMVSPDRYKPILITDMVASLLEVIYGAVLPVGDAPYFKFLNYNPARAIVKHFGVGEYADFQLEGAFLDIMNRLAVVGPTAIDVVSPFQLWAGDNLASQDDFGLTIGGVFRPRVYARTIPDNGSPHPWLNSYSLVAKPPYHNPFFAFGVASTSLQIFLPRYCGFCGTTTETSGGIELFPPSAPSQRAEHRINGTTRPGWFLITDHAGHSEYLKATNFVWDSSAGITVEANSSFLANALIGTTRDFYSSGTYTVERAQFGSTALDWATLALGSNDGIWVYDITIPVFLVQMLLDRASGGIPQASFRAESRHADKEIGDAISISARHALAFGMDGFSVNNIFEIVGKEPMPYEDQPGYKFKIAWMRNGSTPGETDVDPGDTEIPVSTGGHDAWFDETGAFYIDALTAFWTT